MAWIKRLFAGGSAGNEQLTAMVAAVLVLLLAIEGATLLQLRSLLTVHAFVGMLLIPVVGLKLASIGLANAPLLPSAVRSMSGAARRTSSCACSWRR